MLFSTPHTRRASRTRSGRTSAQTISSGRPPPVTIGTPSKLQMLASPIESNVPSLPHMQTDAVYIKLQNAFDWLVTCQAWRIGAVYPAVRSMISAPLYAHSRAISGNMPSWQMISASLEPFGPSQTGIPRLPGSQGSTGTQGWSLR